MTKEEVHKICPSLKAVSEIKSDYLLPNNYFAELETHILSRIELEAFTKSEGFQAPVGYLDSVEDVVIAKLKATAIHGDSSSKEIPENYFSSIEDKVLQRLKGENSEKKSSSKTKVISLKNYKKILIPIAAAASMALLFTLGKKQQEEVSFENLALSEIEYALETNILDYDSESILEIFPEVETSLTDLEIVFSEEDNLEDYLYETDLSNLLYE